MAATCGATRAGLCSFRLRAGLVAGTDAENQRFARIEQQKECRKLTRHLFAAAAALGLLTGVASAQTYPPAPPPPVPAIPGAPVAPAPVLAPAPAPFAGSSTTTTTTHGVDEYGQPITQKNTYRDGIAGSSQTQTTTTTSPWGGSNTTKTTTTTDHQ